MRTFILNLVRTSIINDVLSLPVQSKQCTQPPQTISEFYHEIMRRKHDDHKASHSNQVNQFLHFISSSIFIYCYCIVWTNAFRAMVFGILSLALRQGGHAIFEPPCHDEEELLLGFNTKSKCFVFGSYVVAPVFSSLMNAWFAVTFFFILGHTALLWLQYGFRISMVLFVKLATDPITDILAYYRSLYTIFTTRDWKTGSLETFTQHWNKTPKLKIHTE